MTLTIRIKSKLVTSLWFQTFPATINAKTQCYLTTGSERLGTSAKNTP